MHVHIISFIFASTMIMHLFLNAVLLEASTDMEI